MPCSKSKTRTLPVASWERLFDQQSRTLVIPFSQLSHSQFPSRPRMRLDTAIALERIQSQQLPAFPDKIKRKQSLYTVELVRKNKPEGNKNKLKEQSKVPNPNKPSRQIIARPTANKEIVEIDMLDDEEFLEDPVVKLLLQNAIPKKKKGKKGSSMSEENIIYTDNRDLLESPRDPPPPPESQMSPIISPSKNKSISKVKSNTSTYSNRPSGMTKCRQSSAISANNSKSKGHRPPTRTKGWTELTENISGTAVVEKPKKPKKIGKKTAQRLCKQWMVKTGHWIILNKKPSPRSFSISHLGKEISQEESGEIIGQFLERMKSKNKHGAKKKNSNVVISHYIKKRPQYTTSEEKLKSFIYRKPVERLEKKKTTSEAKLDSQLRNIMERMKKDNEEPMLKPIKAKKGKKYLWLNKKAKIPKLKHEKNLQDISVLCGLPILNSCLVMPEENVYPENELVDEMNNQKRPNDHSGLWTLVDFRGFKDSQIKMKYNDKLHRIHMIGKQFRSQCNIARRLEEKIPIPQGVSLTRLRISKDPEGIFLIEEQQY